MGNDAADEAADFGRRRVGNLVIDARPISVSAVPFGPGIDIWRSCLFIGAMMRSLCLLLGGLVRFVPCSIGVNHCRLRHVGSEKCGHGLTSRPRETASEPFLNELYLLVLFSFDVVLLEFLAGPPLGGCRILVILLAAYVGAVREAFVDGAGQEDWVSGSGPGRKRIRLNRKTPAHLVVSMVLSRPRVWKRLEGW